jgi:hypothetical protein
MESSQVAATYNATPATKMQSGLIRGFVSIAAAKATILPTSVPFIGGKPLHDVLAGGITPGSCTVDGTAIGDDRDMNGATQGWWFYVNFGGPKMPFVDKPTATK